MRSDSLASGTLVVTALLNASEEGNAYDFVLLDSQMPEMDGAAVAASIRCVPAIRDVPIIMLTSAAHGRGHTNEMPDGGAPVDACLTKPVRQSQLLNTLTTIRAKRLGRVAHVLNHPHDSAGNGHTPSRLRGQFAATSLRVLVVDDNEVNRKVASRILEKLGIRTWVAENGLEAVRRLTTLPYDAVFMDCQMPVMDGYEATREIRRTEKPGQHLAIIAMTADALAGARERCLAAGMDDYISKPVTIDDLSRAVQKWLLPSVENLPAIQSL